MGAFISLAIILLILFGFPKKRESVQKSLQSITVKVAIIFLILIFIYALGNPIYLGHYRLLTIGGSDGYLPIVHETFRTTGRYMWVINYAIILYICYLLCQLLPKPLSHWLIVSMVLINLYETNVYTGLLHGSQIAERAKHPEQGNCILIKPLNAGQLT